MWLLTFFLFVAVSATIELLADRMLGVTQALAHLPRWKVWLHETVYFLTGILFCVVLFR